MTVSRLAPDKLANVVQGNIVPGFSKDHQAFVLVSFADRAAGRAWLRAIVSEIATCTQVGAFKAVYKATHPPGTDPGRLPVTARWTNVALSWRGLERLLGSSGVAGLPPTFKTNRVPFAQPRPDHDQVHALLILAADAAADLAVDLDRHRGLLSQLQVREVQTFIGQAGAGARRGVEHFGFKDLVSQPRVAGLEPEDPKRGPSLPAGEFIVGAPGAHGESALGGPEWTRYGSYAVFLQLEQHVGLFREATQRAATGLGVSAEGLQAGLVGRCQNGDPLGKGPPPPTSHIGRAVPRAIGAAEANRHRLLRRGISYGEPLAEGATDTGGRGLLFLAYQADLQRQFERVWGLWLNSPNIPAPGSGVDPLVGQTPGLPPGALRTASVARVGPNSGAAQLRLPQFVTPHYGGYFFSPSIHGLSDLAGMDHAASQGGRPW